MWLGFRVLLLVIPLVLAGPGGPQYVCHGGNLLLDDLQSDPDAEVALWVRKTNYKAPSPGPMEEMAALSVPPEGIDCRNLGTVVDQAKCRTFVSCSHEDQDRLGFCGPQDASCSPCEKGVSYTGIHAEDQHTGMRIGLEGTFNRVMFAPIAGVFVGSSFHDAFWFSSTVGSSQSRTYYSFCVTDWISLMKKGFNETGPSICLGSRPNGDSCNSREFFLTMGFPAVEVVGAGESPRMNPADRTLSISNNSCGQALSPFQSTRVGLSCVDPGNQGPSECLLAVWWNEVNVPNIKAPVHFKVKFNVDKANLKPISAAERDPTIYPNRATVGFGAMRTEEGQTPQYHYGGNIVEHLGAARFQSREKMLNYASKCPQESVGNPAFREDGQMVNSNAPSFFPVSPVPSPVEPAASVIPSPLLPQGNGPKQDNTDANDAAKSGLATGALVGIISGAAVLLCCYSCSLILAAVWYIRKNKGGELETAKNPGERTIGKGEVRSISPAVIQTQVSNYQQPVSSDEHERPFIHHPTNSSNTGPGSSILSLSAGVTPMLTGTLTDHSLTANSKDSTATASGGVETDLEGFTMSNKLLGSGSFGEVYLGMARGGEFVAIKRVRLPDAPKEMKKAQEEASLLERLEHPHIVKHIHTSVKGTYLYVVLEYLAGGSLRGVLKLFGRVSEGQAAVYIHQCCAGLKYLHNQNIIHRDIKPENILCSQTGTCKLTDFGTASVREAMGQGNSKSFANLNQQPTVWGTMNSQTYQGTIMYSSPEAMEGQVSRKCDIWSLGLTLYELLTGRLPFDPAGKGPFQVMTMIMNLKSIDIPEEISLEAGALIKSMLNYEPKERATIEEVLESDFLKVNLN